jgi:hypothetical protein
VSLIQLAGQQSLISECHSFNKSLSEPLIEALTDPESSPKGLRALNTTLYALTPEQLGKILAVQKNVMVLQATAEVEPGEECKKALLKGLEVCKDLEQVEIVSHGYNMSAVSVTK